MQKALISISCSVPTNRKTMLPKYFKTVIIAAFNSHLFLIVNLQDSNQPQQEELICLQKFTTVFELYWIGYAWNIRSKRSQMVLLNIFKIPLRTSCDSVVPCLFQRNVTENYYTSEMVGDERFDCYIYSDLKEDRLIKLTGNFNPITVLLH